ncbi:MAG: diguanylate cyclase [Oceanospirillaceae bacterium]
MTKSLSVFNKAKNSKQYADNFFESSKAPMLIIKQENGSISYANSAAINYYGYSHQQITKLKITDINQLSNNEIQQEITLAAEEKRDYFFFTHKLANGQCKEVEVHSGPMTIDKEKFLYSIIHDITERRAVEQELNELNSDFITLLENTSDFIYFKDINCRLRFCSQTLAVITNHENWRDMIGKHDLEIFPPNTAKIYIEEELPIINKGDSLIDKINPHYDQDGRERWVCTNKWPVFDADKKIIGLCGISRDITAKHQMEEEQRISASVFKHVSDGILITNTNRKVIKVNDAFCKLSGYSSAEVIGKPLTFLKSDYHDTEFFTCMHNDLLQNKYWQGDVWNKRKDGTLFASRVSINAVTNKQGNVLNYISTFVDITSRLRKYQKIEQMAYFDALTGLPNRVLFKEILTKALAKANDTKTRLVICFLDLDNFKYVNDNYGHKTGDLLLVEIAKRIKSSMNTYDTVARMGGDEFAMIIPNLKTLEKLKKTLVRILDACSKPFNSPDNTSSVSASIGCCIYYKHNFYEQQLLSIADLAMYRAKNNGKNQYYICPDDVRL